jgi:sugar phosphate isomerase/epimerase
MDAQADVLKEVMQICKKNQVQPNLHNHMDQVKNNMYDLKETLKRVPDAKLGPDLGWLKKAGVDPVKFIKMYGDRMVFMHILDVGANGKWTKIVGQGIMNWPAIVKALRSVGFSGQAAIELDFPGTPSRGANLEKYWAKSRTFVKKTFGW